jgi:hypothetical protein
MSLQGVAVGNPSQNSRRGILMLVRGLRFSTVGFVCAVGGLVLGSGGVAWAGSCANEALRTGASAALPDCRAYEQVSPVLKSGVDALGSVGVVQASSAGAGVSYFAMEPFPGTVGAAQVPSYLGLRTPDGGEWSTLGVEALAPPGAFESVVAVTEDLSKAIVEVGSQQADTPPCEPRLVVCASYAESNAYVRDNATGSFQLLASQSRFTELGFADATPGGRRVLFETEAKLAPEAEPGVNLYEWDEAKPSAERVSLVGVLPSGVAPKEGSFAGPGGPAVQRQKPRQTFWPFYTQNTISEDGSRVFFSDIETGFVYMREPEAGRTIEVSAGKEPAYWRAATRDGGYVFYTEGETLYRFNVSRFKGSAKPEPEALEEAREPLTAGGNEGVLGVLGISEEDGSYAYFVARGVLAANTNGSGETAVEGGQNLYVWHDGVTTFIAPGDGLDWLAYAITTGLASEGPSGGGKASRVTPDGKQLLFYSKESLTGYNNNGLNEFYLYNSEQPFSPDNPVCVSCNPKGVPAAVVDEVTEARLDDTNRGITLHPNSRNPFLTHNLSSDGRRVFFETAEALVPGDENFETKDVYEWEADGEGSCTSEAQDHGCLYLISTGQSPEESYFGDASPDGSDVFFFTRQPLVAQDGDSNGDLYDARIGGGIAAQNTAPAAAPCAEEAGCRGASSGIAPMFGAPASSAFSGAGNLAPQAAGLASTPKKSTPKKKTVVQGRATKLAKALKVCRAKPKSKRKSCEVAARRRYGPVRTGAKKSSRGGRRS